MSLVDEPVRGSLPPPEFFGLPGIDQVRAILDGLVGPLPIHHLTGVRLTQVSVGSVTAVMPISPWLVWPTGQADAILVSELAMSAAAQTIVPPGVRARLRTMQHTPLRWVTPENRTFLARATVARSNRRVAFVTVEVEDADGRTCAHGAGTFALEVMTPTPSRPTSPLRPVEPPRYATPDPWKRPLPDSARASLRYFAAHGWPSTRDAIDRGELELMPAWVTYGVMRRKGSTRPGGERVALVDNHTWGRVLDDTVTPGFLAAPLAATGGGVVLGVTASTRLDWAATTITALRPVPADGRTLTIEASAEPLTDGTWVVTAVMADESGPAMRLDAVALTVAEGDRRTRTTASRRLLRTVLFTDLVNSTHRAAEVGEGAWAGLRERHDGIVRAHLSSHHGHEVKSLGDGFLATFESPSNAVRCAAAICRDVGALGVAVRAGVHTGEVEEVDGDVTGMAVNLAARVEAAAEPGSVVVSDTTRMLSQGGDLAFEDAGEHDLKGFAEPVHLWRLVHDG